MKTQELISKAFNKDLKEVSNDNTYIPTHGVNDADRVLHFDNYNKDLVYKIKQIKAQ